MQSCGMMRSVFAYDAYEGHVVHMDLLQGMKLVFSVDGCYEAPTMASSNHAGTIDQDRVKVSMQPGPHL
jgi:hypothetical protein